MSPNVNMTTFRMIRKLYISVALAIVVVYHITFNSAIKSTPTTLGQFFKYKNSTTIENSGVANKFGSLKRENISIEFYDQIFGLFDESRTIFKYLPHLKIKSHNFADVLTQEELLQRVQVDKVTLQLLRNAHSTLFDNLPSKFPENLYQGTGVVYIGGGQFSWLSLLALKNLRDTGSKLPVEVIIPSKEEYELDYCETILPTLNAKCILLDDVFHPDQIRKWNFKGYQYKPLALVASSFDNTLLLDSDNMVLENPDNWFDEEPFTTHGMVIWPDFWRRTTSPHFYSIVNITVGPERVRDGRLPFFSGPKTQEKKLIPFHDRDGALPDVSSESGQLMIRKSDHSNTLLLSLYYNVFGPNFYYRLLGQGQAGDGDKDTFISGAVKSNETFYQVKQGVRAFGNFKDNSFHGVGMGQRNPVEDYKAYMKFKKELYDEPFITMEEAKKKFSKVKGSPFFSLHANLPKLNPSKLFKDKTLMDSKGKRIRLYGDIEKQLGFDFELAQWERIKYFLCDLSFSLKCFTSTNRIDLCQGIDEHLSFLRINRIKVDKSG